MHTTGIFGRRAPVRERAGGTLVEVMIGIVVLMVLAIAGGSYLAESRGTLLVQRNKGIALAAASGRLEALRASYYSQLTNGIGQDYTTWYITWNNATGRWDKATSDPGETSPVSGMAMPMRTTLQYVDLVPPSGDGSCDALRIRVQAGYFANQWVGVETLVAP